MVDKNTPGDKKLSVPSKTLTLKPRVETGTVRQSFPHGRTKQVVVEKRGKRRVGGDGQAPEAPQAAPEPATTTARAAPAGVFFGWKNFYAKDHPMMSPHHTMARTPQLSMISYQ